MDSRFGKPSSFVHLSNVQCSGTEEKLSNCSATTIPAGSDIVEHVNVAGVICKRVTTTIPTTTLTTEMPSTDTTMVDQRSQPLTIGISVIGVGFIAAVVIIIL